MTESIPYCNYFSTINVVTAEWNSKLNCLVLIDIDRCAGGGRESRTIVTPLIMDNWLSDWIQMILSFCSTVQWGTHLVTPDCCRQAKSPEDKIQAPKCRETRKVEEHRMIHAADKNSDKFIISLEITLLIATRFWEHVFPGCSQEIIK